MLFSVYLSGRPVSKTLSHTHTHAALCDGSVCVCVCLRVCVCVSGGFGTSDFLLLGVVFVRSWLVYFGFAVSIFSLF